VTLPTRIFSVSVCRDLPLGRRCARACFSTLMTEWLALRFSFQPTAAPSPRPHGAFVSMTGELLCAVRTHAVAGYETVREASFDLYDGRKFSMHTEKSTFF